MSKIITFGNQKGGVGKSTLTMLAANSLSQPPFNFKVIVLDLDKQKSLLTLREYDKSYYQMSPFPYTIVGTSTDELLKSEKLKSLDQEYDFILIDLGGKLDNNLSPEAQEIGGALFNCDYIFMPFTSGNFGLDASIEYLNFALRVKEIRKNSPRPLHIHGFINMHSSRTRASKYLSEETLEIANIEGIKFMDNNLNNYALFRELNSIETLYTESSSSDTAKENFRKWFDEFYQILSN